MINHQFQQAGTNATHLRNALQHAQDQLNRKFYKTHQAAELIKQRSQMLDLLLQHTWRSFLPTATHLSLIAVGGYGRQELFPYSDIDILILCDAEQHVCSQAKIERFITLLWDLKLNVGHSVRTVAECVQQARSEATIYTNLLQGRSISGNKTLFSTLHKAIQPPQIWQNSSFLAVKYQEHLRRHAKYNNTAYHLEPDIKNGPGGLRDIQMIAWLAKQYYAIDSFSLLAQQGILTKLEYHNFQTAQELLWRIRYAIHILAQRPEERLLFDYQHKIAQQFGYLDQENTLAIEAFMKDYYYTIKNVRATHQILLQTFQEKNQGPLKITPLSPKLKAPEFELQNDYLSITDKTVFSRTPECLLKLFVLLAQEPKIKGTRANTLRSLRDNKHRIDEKYRHNKQNNLLFMQILTAHGNIPQALTLMNRFDVLGQYIPEFGKIVGRTQHDLFHAYTVDQHTLFLINHLYSFMQPEAAATFPICHRIMQSIYKQEILYIAALFHDIAKGRHGDHSKLGAIDAEFFCQRHDLAEEDSQLITWLVRNHLLMSITAQRQDIHDLNVVLAFCKNVKSQRYLDYLYVLTIADIIATNKTLWNSWKDSLLRNLYASATQMFAKKQALVSKTETIQIKQEAVLPKLIAAKIKPDAVRALWETLGPDYLFRETISTIAWHCEGILKHTDKLQPLILTRTIPAHGASEIFVYTKDRDNLFATSTAILDRLHLNIVEARIITSSDGFSLDTYIVLDERGKPIDDLHRHQRIQNLLYKYHCNHTPLPTYSQRHLSSQLQHFCHRRALIDFACNSKRNVTELTVICLDRPGLLARIGRAFSECHIRLHNAKIITLGDRVEDVFYITDKANRPIMDKTQQHALAQKISHYLEDEEAAEVNIRLAPYTTEPSFPRRRESRERGTE